MTIYIFVVFLLVVRFCFYAYTSLHDQQTGNSFARYTSLLFFKPNLYSVQMSILLILGLNLIIKYLLNILNLINQNSETCHVLKQVCTYQVRNGSQGLFSKNYFSSSRFSCSSRKVLVKRSCFPCLKLDLTD